MCVQMNDINFFYSASSLRLEAIQKQCDNFLKLVKNHEVTNGKSQV